jgi:hypothetical protein
VLDVRVYRAAFLPALIAVFVAAFSLADRPVPTTTGLSAQAFDSGSAFGDGARPRRNSLNELARTFPNRAAGSNGDARLADRVAETLGQRERNTSRPAFEVTRTQTEWDGDDLQTVVGVRPGLSSRRIVVMAARDAAGRPGRAELSATAALLELARIYRQRDLRKTLVLVSTSGATTGFAGARAWARRAADAQGPSPVDAVLVLGDMAGKRIRKPWVAPWPADDGSAPLALQRTVESALRAEVSPNPGGARASGQWVRRALPLTLSAQGVVAAEDLPAVAIGSTGELAPRAEEPVKRARLSSFGRGLLRAVTAIDEAGPIDPERASRAPTFTSGPDGIVVMRNVLPDWAVRMLVGTLLLPALLVALDAWFRARRRHLPVGRWAGWIAAGAVAPLLAWLWLRLLGLTAALSVPTTPVEPDLYKLGTAGIVALVSTAIVAAVGWFGVRPLVVGRLGKGGNAAAGGLAAALGLVVNLVALVVWLFNPYAAALLLPAAHLWLLAAAPTSRLRGAWAALPVALGVALPLLVVVHYLSALELNPLSFAWLLALATADGHVSFGTALTVSLWLACLAGLLVVLRVRRKVEATAEPERPKTRGPASYAGPGSLGGTESALRR